MSEGFLLDRTSVNNIGKMMTRVFGPTQGPPVGGSRPFIETFELKHVRLLDVEPSPTGDIVGYTAEVLKMDLTTNLLTSTGITFDPNGSVGDDDIIKAYIYEVNGRDDLVGKVGEATFKYSTDDTNDGAWVFSGGGGSSLIWLTTDNTGLSEPDGAKYDKPAGTATSLTASDTFYIVTPWNTKIVAPNNHFGYFVQDGTDWYKHINQFAVKPSANYPSGAGAGIETFTCYMDRSDTSLNLGTNTAFPTGIKVILDGFDNVNAGTTSLAVFNGKVFWASYDSAANIIYIIDKNRF